MLSFATSRIVHTALNRQLGPWFRERGWIRRKGSICAYLWINRTSGQNWMFWIQCSAWGSKDRGSKFTANLPKVNASGSNYSSCRFLGQTLTDTYFAEAHAIASRIAERNRKSQIVMIYADVWERKFDIWFPYYSSQDVDDWGAYLRERLPQLTAKCYEHAA